jgi:hypothetical protein
MSARRDAEAGRLVASPNCPDEFKGAADWERRIKHPNGYVCDEDGRIELYLDQSSVPEGIRPSNSWRRPVAGGRGPSLERKLRQLLKRFGGSDPSEEQMEALLELLSGGPRFIVPVKLFGFRRARTLLQVNADNVLLELLDETSRYKCSVCNERVPWATDGLPCPSCHGIMVRVPEAELRANRYVLRIRRPQFRPLVAGEHTAQVTGAARIELEQAFKAIPERSPVNVLACSPTLEMGIDAGGLDAVVMRNIPPRPDNYAQRGGRSGRRTRVGVVVGYARRTPHDGYFFDKPREMIAGEVPAPSVGLTNRDVLRRHLNAILFGTTNPPLAGRMSEYLNNQGALKPEAIEALLAGPLRLPQDRRVAAPGRLARQRQAGRADLAPRGAEGARPATEAQSSLAERRLLHPTQGRAPQSRVVLRLRRGSHP